MRRTTEQWEGVQVKSLEYAVEKRVKTIVGPPIWRRITGWHRSKMSAMAHVGYEDSHRTLRLMARVPASDPWVVTP